MVETTEAIRIQLQFEADKAKKDSATMTRQLQAMERRLDPLARATQRFDKGLSTLDKNLAAGKIDVQRYEKNLAALNREMDVAKAKAAGAGAAIANVNAPASTMANVIQRNRSVFQQAGYQVGDFAVQVQGGTSAITAFTQQGSQMLGVFGAYGAIAGAALAIGAPLAASFFSSDEAAATYEETVDELTEALNAYRAAAELAATSDAGLAAQFGQNAEVLRGTLNLLREIEQVNALDAAVAAAAAFSAEYQNIFDLLDNQNAGYFSEFLIAGISMARDEATALRDAIAAVGVAAEEGPGAAADATMALNDLLLETFGSAELIPPEFRDMATAAGEATKANIELADGIEQTHGTILDTAAAAYTIGDGLFASVAGADALIGRAQVLAATLWNAAAAMSAARSEAISRGPDGAVQDVRERLTPQGLDRSAIVSQKTYAARIPKARGGGGGRSRGGGSSRRKGSGGSARASQADREAQRELNEMRRDAARVIESLLTETQKYERELADLTKLNKAGELTTEQFAAAQANLRQEFMETQWKESGLGDFVDDLSNAIANSESLGDVFVAQVRRMAAELINSGLTSIAQNIFGNALSGGGFGGGSGGGFLGKLLSFDGGGFTGGGSRSGGIDGRGGFPAILHPNETVVDHTKRQPNSIGGGQGVHVTVGIDVDSSGNLTPFVSSLVQAGMDQQGRALPAQVSALTKDPRRR